MLPSTKSTPTIKPAQAIKSAQTIKSAQIIKQVQTIVPARTIVSTPVTIALVTAFGILLHDMHVDRATTLAVVSTVAVAGAGAGLEKLISTSDHTHVEKASFPHLARAFSSSAPKVEPPRSDGRHYSKSKKLSYSGGEGVSLWPSV